MGELGEQGGGGDFPQTRWSLLLNAAADDPAALAELCRDYWFPIYAYARLQGKGTEDAEDLTQGFFAKILSTDFLSRIKENRGRLRSFLLTAFRNFMRDEWQKGQAVKRGSGVQPLSFDTNEAETLFAREPTDGITPEREFDRTWAREILRQALERVRASYSEAGKAEEFALLEEHLDPEGGRPYSELAAELGIKEARIRYLVFKLRQRFSHFLREAVGETVLSHEEIEEELAYIRRVFESPDKNTV